MRKFFAFLLLLIFTPVFISTILTWNVGSTLLNKEFVKEQLSKNKVYEFIHTEVFPTLTSELEDIDIEGVSETGVFTTDDFTQLLQDSVSKDFLQKETENIIDNIYPYFTSQKETFEIEISLGEVKKSFEKNYIKLVVNEIKKLPTCTTNQMFEVNENTTIAEVLCVPPGLTTKKLTKALGLSELSKEVSGELPNKIIITNEKLSTQPKSANLFSSEKGSEGYSQETQESLTLVRGLVTPIDFAKNFLLASLVIILILIATLRLKSLKSITKWVGWALLIPSFLVFSATLFLNLVLITRLPEFLSSLFTKEWGVSSSSVEEKFFEFFTGNSENLGLIFKVMRDVNQPIIIQTGVTLAIALILIIAGVLIKSKGAKDLLTAKG